MRNNSLSLLGALCLSTAFFINPAFAQNPAGADQPAKQEAKAATALATPLNNKQEVNTPAAPGSETGTLSASEKEKKLLEVEMPNTTVNPEQIIDFPGRASLGTMEMATLPGVNETLITGPAPMGESLSTKDLPSEQLLGRITSEVFQEMADLERGNVFLKLQMQKEQLKNDLEKLKATYRQARLEEIAKREDVVRSRINWWQEQENIRLEMERKKAETEAIEQQIAEAEELRNKLRAEAIAEKEQAQKEEDASSQKTELVAGQSSVTPADDTAETEKAEKEVRKNGVTQRASELYALLGVRGLKDRLSARLKNNEDGSIITVKEKQKLSTGHRIKKIERDSIVISYAGRDEVIVFATVKPAEENDESNTGSSQEK